MTLEIIGFGRSNFVRAVRMVAHEKGVDYKHNEALPHSDEVKAIHPLGQIPVIRHDGLELAESQAIIRYIDRSFDGPKLIPEDPKAAAKVEQWMSIAATPIDQLFMRNYVVEYLFHKDDEGNVVRTKIDGAVKRMPRLLGKIGDAVSEGFFGSAAFSAADCILAPILSSTQMFPEGKEFVAANEKVKAYFDKISERDSFAATAP